MFNRSKKRDVTMRDRFITRVLLPPFLLLVIIGGVGFWRLNSFLTDQAVTDLRTAAQATAIRLERETAIRETVLKNTADEITFIEGTYISDLAALEKNRAGCREYYLQRFRFTGSPDDVCAIFIQGSAGARPSLAVIEDVYIERALNLQTTEISNINQRLSAFKQFFPETLALMIIGDQDRIVSSAVSGGAEISSEDFLTYALAAKNEPVTGTIIDVEQFELAVFAFPTDSGSVLAAYDVNNATYIRPTWLATPINQDEALAIIVENGQNVVYPSVRNEFELLSNTRGITPDVSTKTRLGDVENIVVAEKVADTAWTVLITSPEAIVFAPLRDTQFTAVLIAGLFIIGFLWVGTFFIKKTTDSIAQLVTGAMVYGSGRLDYKLNLASSEKEFRQLADTMNYMARRIADSERQIDEKNKEFISIATHELRAPMTSIIGYLSMLKENMEHKLTKENTLLFDNAYDGTIKLRDLVNDMLDAARLEGGREEFVIKKLDIIPFVSACLQSMEVVAKQNAITLTYDDTHAGSVYADEAKLRIILNNFISNAIKYNRHAGKVEVSHKVHDGQLVTAIANNGPSIPEEQQAHMFEKFFRVDSPEHKKIKGTGIGMYVTKQYVETMNGKVWFSSSEGKDTIFYFSLPMSGKESLPHTSKIVAPKQANSKWIMRWRKRMK